MVNKENNYELCYKSLCKEFGKHNPKEMADKSGATYNPEKKQFTLIYLNKEYLISYPQGIIMLNNKDSKVLSDNITIISYLFRCTKSTRENNWLPYRELQGVGAAYDTFSQLGVNKLVNFFGHRGELFLKAGTQMGAKKFPSGDVGIELNIFPNVPMVLILWLEDEEFEARANILFDSSATKELHREDLAGLCSTVAREIIRVAKELSI